MDVVTQVVIIIMAIIFEQILVDFARDFWVVWKEWKKLDWD